MEDLLDGTGGKALAMSVDFHIVVSSQASLKTLSVEALVAYALMENIFCFLDRGCLSRHRYLVFLYYEKKDCIAWSCQCGKEDC